MTVAAQQAETLKVKIQNDHTILPFVAQPSFNQANVQSITSSKHHSPIEWEIVKITYENYTMKKNPLPYYNEIPGLIIQPTLPLKMKIEENGQVFTYQFDYIYDNYGKVKERKVPFQAE